MGVVRRSRDDSSPDSGTMTEGGDGLEMRFPLPAGIADPATAIRHALRLI